MASVLGMARRTMPKASTHPSIKDLHWAAGLLEGEGCFTAGTNGSERVHCEMADEAPIKKLQALFGGSVKARKPKKENRKPTFAWWICGSRARGVMMTLYILLSPRRQQRIIEMLTHANT